MEAITLIQLKHIVVGGIVQFVRAATQGLYLSLSASSVARRDPTSEQHDRTAWFATKLLLNAPALTLQSFSQVSLPE